MNVEKLKWKCSLILAALLLGTLPTFSQIRTVDLEVVCDSPADTVVNGIGEPLRFCTYNNGPNFLYNRDTILYALYVIENGNTYQVYSGATIGTSDDTIAIGGSRCYVDNYNILFPYPGRNDTFTVEFCVAVGSSYINQQGDTVHPFTYIDPDTENNLCCKSVTVIPRPNTAIATADKEADVIIYPNPASDMLYIRTGSGFSADDFSLSMYDVNGRLVLEQAYEKGYAGINERAVDVSKLPAGLYQVRLQSGDGMISRKLVISR